MDLEKHLREQLAISEFVTRVLADITSASDVKNLLQRCAEHIVEQLNATVARIWLYNSAGKLELQGSADPSFTHDESYIAVDDSRDPMPLFDIEFIARSGNPFLSNDIRTNPRLTNREWAKSNGILSFAGYPLKRKDTVIGIINIFSRKELVLSTLNALTSVAGSLVIGIDGIRAKKELEGNRLRLQKLFESAPNGIIMVDRNSTMRMVNHRAEDIFHYSRGELLGESVNVLCPDRYRARHELQMEEFFKAAQSRPMGAGRDLVGLCKDGAEVPIEIGLTSFQDAELGLCVIVTTVDITVRKQAEQRVSEFYSTVSHELRTPLTSIRGALGLMAGGKAGELSAKATKLVKTARTETERLVRLINDILDLRKLESGMIELRMEDCTAGELVGAAKESLSQMAKDNGVSLVVSELGEATIPCDRDRIIQALVNLVGNAIKFSQESATVTLRTVPASNGFMRFEVVDNGPGIARQDLHKVFARFQQLDQSDSRVKGGTGLGLAITKAIVEEHGGVIGLESELGKGSTFWFELPIGHHHVEKAETSEEAAQPVAHTALVIEDDEAFVTVLNEQLADFGFSTTHARTLAEARVALACIVPDVILLDLRLPDGDGLDILGSLKGEEKTAEIPVIVISARRQEESGICAPIVMDWLEKPFSIERLNKTLAQTLRTSGNEKPVVLIVDDDDVTRQVLQELLSPLPVECIEAADGVQAVTLAAEKKPDLIILDIGIPEVDGFHVVQMLREHKQKGTALIVYTNRDLDASDKKKLSLGLTRYLSKTESSEAEFMSSVKELLDGLLSMNGVSS